MDLTASAGPDIITAQYQFEEIQSSGVCCSDDIGTRSFDLSSLGLTNISGPAGWIGIQAGYDKMDFADFGANNLTILEL